MSISFGVPTDLSIAGSLAVGGAATLASSLTLSNTTASSLLYGNASKAVASVVLSSNLSLTTGTLALAAALTGINSVTAASGQDAVFQGGNSGASLVLGQGASGRGTLTNGATNITDQLVLVNGSGGSTTRLHLGQFGSGSFIYNNYYFTGSANAADDASKPSNGIQLDTSGDITFQYAAASATPSRSALMSLKNTGNLLIGTTTDLAAYKLNVYGATSANVIAANGVTPDGTKTGGTFTTVLGGTGAATGAYALAGDIAGRFVMDAYGNNFIYEAGAIQSTITTGGNADRNLHVAALDFQTKPTGSNAVTTVARLTGTGNLLIGTTTDMSGVAGGLKIASSAASTGVGTGALQVAGGIYAGAASVFGSTLTVGANIEMIGGANLRFTGAGGGLFYTSGYSQPISIQASALNLNTLSGGVTTIGGTTSGTSTTAAAILGKSMGLTENLFVGGQLNVSKNTNGYDSIKITGPSGNHVGIQLSQTGVTDWSIYNTATTGNLYFTGGGTDALVLTKTTGAATFGGVTVLKHYTVATLPAAASYTYGTAFVSDATNAAGTGAGTAPTGGGAVVRLVYCTGAAWLLV